ncbi:MULTISPECIES: ATP-binding protein [unclassified Nonomuraea]|uniref:ATP-binding protein n=1 Tax=unclassified Nonomuraea TaxID=2593643 RepID=UPI001F1ADBA0|nr:MULTISPECIES: ATP-binding protein [unclassified Nonomuraea]
MIVWINGTHGAGKTTTGALVQPLLPDARVFDAEKVGVTLTDIRPGLPSTDNFQHWPSWRSLVVETGCPGTTVSGRERHGIPHGRHGGPVRTGR